MTTTKPGREAHAEHRVQFPVECPRCHWRHFLEVGSDDFKQMQAAEIRAHLESWVASRCPAHLGPIMEMSKN
jgi:hypothetical protein